MTTLPLVLKPGESIFDQVVSAAQKAIMSGEFSEGQLFPSVRALAADLKIHYNTAHKAVQYLIGEGWLEARPGIGTVIAPSKHRLPEMRRQLIRSDVEALVRGAKKVELQLADVIEAVEQQWVKGTAKVRR